MKGSHTYNILKCKDGQCEEVEDLLALEMRLRITINKTQVMSLMCTPLMVRELVVGLVMTEGIAEGLCTERMSIIYGEEEIDVELHAEGEVRTEGASVTSGCVGGITFDKKHATDAREDPLKVNAESLRNLFAVFMKSSDLYTSTGCMHAAALSDGEHILCFAEDIGRHNAVDKVLGYTILEGEGFKGRIMLASGRLSSEIISKCARWGIPVVASRAAPTARAIDLARESGITVIGFLRGQRMNIYSHPERITATEKS